MMLPTIKAYNKYFKEDKNLRKLFIKALSLRYNAKKLKTIMFPLLSLILSISFVFLADKTLITPDLLHETSSLIIGYSISILGFMAVAFTLVMTLANNKLSMWLFCDDKSNYNSPPIKVLLLYFCYPMTLFLMSFMFSLFIYLISILNIDLSQSLKMAFLSEFLINLKTYYQSINEIAFGGLLFIVFMSVFELPAFVYNLYIFIVLFFNKMSQLQETAILEKMINNEELDSYEKPFESEITKASDK